MPHVTQLSILHSKPTHLGNSMPCITVMAKNTEVLTSNALVNCDISYSKRCFFAGSVYHILVNWNVQVFFERGLI
jgi:hypothetical protein